jgi:probable FeS assembly SUF system protein SufT
MHKNTERTLTRDCPAIQIPAGNNILLPAGSTVFITQSLGGSYTVATEMGLARVSAQNADALGLEESPAAATAGSSAPPKSGVAQPDAPVDEKSVWDQLKTCYDPEIPVNIVDLGLIYDCQITPRDAIGALVTVKMTLTAPGCGMGPVLAQEAKAKIETLPGVDEANVELVWDPPWNQAMISEAGKMQLGII